MSIEILPLGQRCNLTCKNYCYENSMRDAGNTGDQNYDIDRMLDAAIAAGAGNGTGITGFGGEFLLTPIADVEKILERAKKINAPFGIQTNGTILTDRHVELFKQYNVSVGVSMDGPEELNDERTSRDESATRKTTALSQQNLERLLREGISISLIVTVHATNAGTDEKLDKLIAWVLRLRDLGLRYVNLHLLEPHGPDSLSMSQDRQTEVFRRLNRELVGFTRVSPFADMRNKLLQESGAHCTFNHCSPYSTPAVTGINGQGEAARCGRLNNDGVAWERSAKHGHERYVALYLTPMERGGCGGCRFFVACGGHCPGEGAGGDWRRKTVHCKTLTALFKDLEQELFEEGKEPISMSIRRPSVEAQLLGQWTGKQQSANRPHADVPHGDSYEHGDHTDAAKPVIIDKDGKRIQ